MNITQREIEIRKNIGNIDQGKQVAVTILLKLLFLREGCNAIKRVTNFT